MDLLFRDSAVFPYFSADVFQRLDLRGVEIAVTVHEDIHGDDRAGGIVLFDIVRDVFFAAPHARIAPARADVPVPVVAEGDQQVVLRTVGEPRFEIYVKSLSSPQVKPSFSYHLIGVSSPSGCTKDAVPLLNAASASGLPFLIAS